MLERPPGSDPAASPRCSIQWVVDFEDILSAELAGASGSSGGSSGPGGSRSGPVAVPSQVVINLRTAAKDRMLSGAVSSRVVQCQPGTQQAATLLAAVRSGLREVAALQQQQQKAARTGGTSSAAAGGGSPS